MVLPTLLRKVHYWGSIIIAIPLLVVIGTGVLLQLKKQVAWVQPTEMKTKSRVVTITPEQMLAAAIATGALEVKSWEDIARIDIRPDKGLVKINSVNNWELQLHSETGEPLHVAYRRSDLLESLHDGSWFHANAKLFLFLPSGVILFGLWLTGIYLFVLPYWVRAKRRPQAKAARPVDVS